MDSLTARHLARELDALWRERRVRACIFDSEHSAVVLVVDGTTAVRIDLSLPSVQFRSDPAMGAEVAAGRRSLLEGWSVRGVTAPADDRRLVVEFARAGRFKGSEERRATLTISAIPTARGAELRDAGGKRMAVVGARLPRGVGPRPVLTSEEVARAASAGDEAALLGGRWVSRLVARWLVREPDLAAGRYAMLLSDEPARPAWCDGLLVPFHMCADAVEAASLIAPPPEAPADESRRGAAADDRTDRARQRMEGELERARDAPRLRTIADALMLLGDAPAPDSVVLPDGRREPVAARPGESAREAAERLHGRARSMERALQQLPARIAALEKAPKHGARAAAPGERPRGRSATAPAALPYRSYRSTSGLEIRVGKGASSNDVLTFKESSPDDIWLHARDTAGAHVVLRWRESGSPPARALEEAAALAAWYSKSRGAALVPVDWTRRKYVRRARGGAPGAVIVQRSRTVMARPDSALEKSLRDY